MSTQPLFRPLATLALLAGAATAAPAQTVTALVAPGDKGWPIVIDRPGHYRLSGALAVPAGRSAIRISASGVVLDLAGHTVAGPGECSLNLRFAVNCRGNGGAGQVQGIAVDASAHEATIRNGTVRGFETGLALGADSRIERLTVSHNSLTGVELRGGAVLEVRGLLAELNDTALYAADGRMRIERAELRYNGVALWADRSSVLADSVVSDNGTGLEGAPALRGSRVVANRVDASPRRF